MTALGAVAGMLLLALSRCLRRRRGACPGARAAAAQAVAEPPPSTCDTGRSLRRRAVSSRPHARRPRNRNAVSSRR
ncbi:hypothetical protein F4553_006856 [Allocatelliglobosispora scoriae]|uniref:Uncharacterized protein n=1 Tax=Allocatelliglobosispora scoriae TaxID=643052 RepID=A0A841C303_9ACTN|nr:hypothetical protein [Allocatelliglobosispora scoriae]MBB5873422.1 hypothetical protein [Allocatelliglobosispora scoriae]